LDWGNPEAENPDIPAPSVVASPPRTVLTVPFPFEMTGIQEIQLIGDLVAIRWADDERRPSIAMSRLRARSRPVPRPPGERDLLGKQLGATDKRARLLSGVTVIGWNIGRQLRDPVPLLRTSASTSPTEVIAAYEAVIDQVDLDSIAERERVTRHDVKARIEEFNASPATSTSTRA
jgi:hypothetical protein